MRNAKEELLKLLEGKAKVKCATITKGDEWDEDNKDILLKVGYSENEWTEFLNSLNFSYKPGYGGQNLFGTVWLEDGTWCTRSEYDWWEHNQLPEIPSELFFEEEKKEEEADSVEMVKDIFRNMGIFYLNKKDMSTKKKYAGVTTELSDNLLEAPIVRKNPPKKSNKFGAMSLYYDGIYYFPSDIKESDKREGRPFEIQGVYYRGKWYQDTFYITSDFKEFLLNAL